MNTPKRKIISGAIELAIGIAILIYSFAAHATIYRYAGFVFIASGAITLIISAVRLIKNAKKSKNEEAAVEAYYTQEINSAEEVQEEIKKEIIE